jgi:PilZ domain
MFNNGRFPGQGDSGKSAGENAGGAKQPLSKESAGPPGFEDMQSAPRFPVRLPISIKSTSGESHTETENISANGVLFQIDSDMPVGSTVDFTISLPGDVVGADADVQLDCRGRVARSFMEGGRRGVGVVIDEYKFERR